jgi:hypothetical protein
MSRRGKIRAVVVSLLVAVIVLVPLSLRWRAQWQLNAYRKKLIASGEKLTVEEIAPKRDFQTTNTALFLRLASTVLSWQYEPTAMLSIKPGVACVAWRQAQLMEEMDPNKPNTNVWPGLAGEVQKYGSTLDELQKVVEEGGVEFGQDYSQPNLNTVSYLMYVKTLARDLLSRAVLELHQGQRQQAGRDLKCISAVSQMLGKDPIVIDQLVRYACMSIATGGIWEGLQADGWTDDELAQLQHQWEQEDLLALAEAALAMERARGPMEFQLARSSRQGLNDLSGGGGIKNNGEIWHDFLMNIGAVPEDLLNAYPRYWGWKWIWSYRDEQRYMESVQTLIEATQDAQRRNPIQSFAKGQDGSVMFESTNTDSFDIVGSMTQGLGRFVARGLRAQTEANMVTTAIALERYRLAHQAYPDSLAKLTPEFVRKVPVDCMDGKDLRYRLNPDGTYLLYSVGRDGVDNGGDATPEKDKSLSFLNGRDWVWPRAATPEEMQAYEAEQSKPARRK